MFLTVLGWIGLFFAGLVLGIVVILLIKVKKTKRAIFKGLQQRKKFFNGEREKIDEIVKVKRKVFKRKNRFHVFKKGHWFKDKNEWLFFYV